MSTDSDFDGCHSYRLIWRWVLQARDMVQGNVQCSLVKEFKCRKRFAHMLSRGVKRLQGWCQVLYCCSAAMQIQHTLCQRTVQRCMLAPTAIVVSQSLHARHTVSTAAETGGHASATAVTTPNVPSLPMNSCFRSYLHKVGVHACLTVSDVKACSLLLEAACHVHTQEQKKRPPTLCCPCDMLT